VAAVDKRQGVGRMPLDANNGDRRVGRIPRTEASVWRSSSFNGYTFLPLSVLKKLISIS